MKTNISKHLAAMIINSQIRRENYKACMQLRLMDNYEYNAWLEPIVTAEINKFNKEVRQCGS